MGILLLIVELQIVDIHSVTVLDAHFFQPGEQTAFAQLLVEIIPGLVIVEIDVHHQPLQPGTGDHPGAAQVLNGQFGGISGLFHRLHILRFINGHRGEGAQLFGHDPHEIPGTLGGTGGNFVELAACGFHAGTQPTTLIFIFINAWNEYTVALCLISSDTLKPLTVGINIFNGYNMIEWQYLFAASLFAIVPVVILFMSIEKNLTSGLTAGGVKG